MNYEDSGVSIKTADLLTSFIKNTVSSDNIGMFAGLYSHPVLPDYYLVGCTDGVGTKILPLIEQDLIETIAIDLIAMNLNDMICTGASPLFFLDYFATHTLDLAITQRFIKSLKDTLNKYNCILLGGETAELKDLIVENKFDVGGFALGLVKKDLCLTRENVKAGDTLIGLCSSGPHSNGFTLIRHLFTKKLLSKDELLASLKPTHIYTNEILELVNNKSINVCAHITGGGLADNLQRVIPDHLCAEINKKSIPRIPIFEKLQSVIGDEEAYKTFNMGVGMCVVASEPNIELVMNICKKYNPFLLGNILSANSGRKVIYNN